MLRLIFSIFFLIMLLVYSYKSSACEQFVVSHHYHSDSNLEPYMSASRWISYFESSRIGKDSKYYQDAEWIAYKLSSAGYGAITGGGSGIMQAANEGATRAQARSVGFELQASWSIQPAAHLDRLYIFNDLGLRKSAMLQYSNAIVFFPPGLGTMDEFFNLLGSLYMHKKKPIPVILYDEKFWNPVMELLMNEHYHSLGTIQLKDIPESIFIANSPEDVFQKLTAGQITK